MSNDVERKQQASTTLSAEERVGAISPDRKKLSRRQLLGLSAGGLALATAVGIGINFGIHTENNPEQKVPGTSQPVGETTAPSPEARASGVPVSSYEALNQNGGEFSAEALSKLSPEQLTTLFQIKASEFTTIKNGKMPTNPADVAKFEQEYTKIFAQRVEAWENAGCTKAEWAPYENAGKGVFEAAGVAKYNTPISTGIFGSERAPDFLQTNLSRCAAMFGDNQTVYNKVDVVEGSVADTARGNGLINATVLYHFTDNFDLRKSWGNKPEYAPADFTLRWSMNNIAVNADGVIVPGSVDIASTK